MLTTITANKAHIIYICIILGLMGALYTIFVKKPKEITKVVTVTKEVIKEVETKRNLTEDKVITRKTKKGTVTVTREHIHDGTVIQSHTEVQVKTVTKTITNPKPRYTVTTFYPLTPDTITHPLFNPLDLSVMGGVRVFDLPILLNVGTNLRVNQVNVGVTVEIP